MLFYRVSRTTVRQRLTQAAHRVAVATAVRILERLDAATTGQVALAPVISAPPAPACCDHGPDQHSSFGCEANVGFPGLPIAECDCRTPAPTPTVEAAPVVPMLTIDNLPPVEVIEATAGDYDQAADDARAADRAKRKARKLLDRIPAGVYGRAIVERVESARQTPDLDRIRADYARAGLGEVPMRPVAATLKVTFTPAVEVAAAAA
ncbi:hypothetical protein CcI49_28330 [Frankia sp. CcI49]|uniref:hypothetical protein n=1 Tax=Frankia sp. CcI49 TaxID=1745382 RepID=UPI000975DACB|nr:hypothetical protein [Frankia sp. CcI49]ONH55434.1 hypothetical protein CcI49_28330 [Frankia sp. CcI49]